MKNFLAGIANAGRELVGLGGVRRETRMLELCNELLKLRGEAAAIALADELMARYAALDDEGRADFFDQLLAELTPDSEAIEDAIAAYHEEPSPITVMRLSQAVNSPRKELLRALNMAPGGTEALIRMREDLLDRLRQAPYLHPVDADFGYLFRSWFNRGFLRLTRIDWETPAFILEKLISYEAVHEIKGWGDLRRRLERDRRCFAFFHPVLPEEPLIFVEVALVKGLAASIDSVLEATNEAEGVTPDTAIFYSISNCQRGLRGVSFGNFLIKQVTDMLAEELPSLKTYATLSPVPGFRTWLDEAIAQDEALPLKPEERAQLQRLADHRWYENKAATKQLRPVMRKLCAHYFLNVKHGREPRDPVARFHLRNGARLERINWLADKSEKGLRESATLMVNYVYDRRDVLRNHEAFVNEGEIAASSAVRNLAP